MIFSDKLIRYSISTVERRDDMSAEGQIDLLANYIMEEMPEEIFDGGACTVAVAVLKKYREAFRDIMNELGVPGDEYPAPVANAYRIAERILDGG
jgi:hypothetical protein